MYNSKKVDKILKIISDINMKIALACLIMVIFLNGFEIILRYTMGRSMIWIQEISVLLMVWLIFTGTTKTVYNKKDIAIRIFVDKIPEKIRIIIDTFGRIAVLIFLIYYSLFGYKLIVTQWDTRTLVAEIRQIYFTIPVIVMAVSCSLIYINEIYKSINNYMKGVEY